MKLSSGQLAASAVPVVFCASFLLACGPKDQQFDVREGCTDGAPTGETSIILGTDEGEGFREMKDGTNLTIDFGAQGGQHVYYSVRVAGAQELDQVEASVAEGQADSGVQELTPCGEGQYTEILNGYVQLTEDTARTTTMTVKLLRCEATDECDYYGESAGPPPVAIAEAKASINIVEP